MDAPKKTVLLGHIMDGKVRLERLPDTPYISARFRVQGGQVRRSTKETTLGHASEVARRLYVTVLAQAEDGQRVRKERPRQFGTFAEKFFASATEQRRRSDGQWRNLKDKWSLLAPVVVHDVTVKDTRIQDIDLEWLEELRDVRSQAVNKRGETIAPETMKKDLQFIRQVLKFAYQQDAIPRVPPMPQFTREFGISDEANPRLTDSEYEHLQAVALQRVKDAPTGFLKAQRMEVYRFMLVCVDAALRVDEALSLRWSDVTLYTRTSSGRERVTFRVLGKHRRTSTHRETAVGFEVSYSVMDDLWRERFPNGKSDPDAYVFTNRHRDASRELFEAAGLRTTIDGRLRTRRCFRVTGITRRIEQKLKVRKSPSFDALARWARTSPDMIRRYYDQSQAEHAAELIIERD